MFKVLSVLGVLCIALILGISSQISVANKALPKNTSDDTESITSLPVRAEEEQPIDDSNSFIDQVTEIAEVVKDSVIQPVETLMTPAPKVKEVVEDYEIRPYVEIVKPAGYVNTGGAPVTIADYVGKNVILMYVMTYSCINCQRTFPFVNDWYQKYKDSGLVVLGIHTPEFSYEKDIDNVTEAMAKNKIYFPVVLDNDYGTWRALGNRFWPRMYLIDVSGNIVYDHIGEGAYSLTEQRIVQLLGELQ